MNKTLSITDMFQNKIEVTNLEEAISQAKFCLTSPYNMTPFNIVNGVSQDIEARKDEVIPVKDYWQDALNKLQRLQAS